MKRIVLLIATFLLSFTCKHHNGAGSIEQTTLGGLPPLGFPCCIELAQPVEELIGVDDDLVRHVARAC